MTKYEEIAEIAAVNVHKYLQYYESCQRVALRIAAGYADFLECPRKHVAFVLLDHDLERTEKTEPFDLDPVGSNVPMVFGMDGLWYFCFRVKYEKPNNHSYLHEYIKLGLKVSNNVATIKGDQEFELDCESPFSAPEFFEHLYRSSLQRVESPPFMPSKNIGFVQ